MKVRVEIGIFLEPPSSLKETGYRTEDPVVVLDRHPLVDFPDIREEEKIPRGNFSSDYRINQALFKAKVLPVLDSIIDGVLKDKGKIARFFPDWKITHIYLQINMSETPYVENAEHYHKDFDLVLHAA